MIALVQSTMFLPGTATGGTQSTGVDTATGNSTLHVAAVAEYVNGGVSNVSDNIGNVWRCISRYQDASLDWMSLWYCPNPTNSTSHKITVTGVYPCCAFYSFSGLDRLPIAELRFLTQFSSGTSGSFTYSPPIAGLSFFCGVMAVSSGLPSVTGLAGVLNVDALGANVPMWAGYQIQTSPTTINGTVSWSNTKTGNAISALFRGPFAGVPLIHEGLVY
jgi:hypothetical protein